MVRIAMLGAKAVPAIGGIAQYIEEIGSRLVQRGHEVTVYCRPHFLDGQRGDYRGMHRIVTSGLRGKHLDASTHTLTAALHALSQDYDVVHIHGAAPTVVAPLLQLRPPCRLVATLHGLDWSGSKWGTSASTIMYCGARIGVASVDEVTAVSRWVRDECVRRLHRPATFIPTGVSFPQLLAPRELNTVGLQPSGYIFCASRLVPEKGVHYLLEAFAGLDTDRKLVIAGNCPYEDRYVQRLRAAADERVIFVGYVKGRLLAELFSNAYLYVQPSESEGLPLAILEALSYGRCVVASDIPQNQEALGQCGYSFTTRDSEALRAQLAYLLRREDLVGAEFGKARDYIRRDRNWDITTDRYEEIYEGLLLGRKRLRMVSQSA